MTEPYRMLRWDPSQPLDELVKREWLVTNGLGGYASGTIGGAVTRRYHGLLVAALPAPLGRTVMLNHLWEEVRLPDGEVAMLGGNEGSDGIALPGAQHLVAFMLEGGLPVWRYEIGEHVLEKRIVMPHFHNTVQVTYTLLRGEGPVRLRLRPSAHFRSYEAPVDAALHVPYSLFATSERFELSDPGTDLPVLRLTQQGGEERALVLAPQHLHEVIYRMEQERGYAARGQLWSFGYFRSELTRAAPVTLIASTDEWSRALAFRPGEVNEIELERRRHLLVLAPASTRTGPAAELVLAADQFLVKPAGRAAEEARAHAVGRSLRTVIAGYHWFTDWGRDTMISLEGLTLVTGRHREAAYILRTFARYVRDGLIPNMFPDQSTEGLYHTADATLWFFHAASRYLHYTGDRSTIDALMPVFRDIIRHHVKGTHFGIGMDPSDGLLRQGAEGYQLTWMDAKVEDWVVTPRRGKAVEINALWYNALRTMEDWHRTDGDEASASSMAELAERVRASFNRRFPAPHVKHLYDVVDGENGDDDACRPNQVFAISLEHPVLDREWWAPVMKAVTDQLLTPVGLRSLSPKHPDYKPQYWGDLRTRDAAYHQGTVWGWLIGPFIDAWLRLHPTDRAGARRMLHGLFSHMDDFGVGTLAEIFDAEPPFTPRGCIAQAWTVAETLRCWVATAPVEPPVVPTITP